MGTDKSMDVEARPQAHVKYTTESQNSSRTSPLSCKRNMAPAERHVFAIQMRLRLEGNEELAVVCVGPGIGHGENPRLQSARCAVGRQGAFVLKKAKTKATTKTGTQLNIGHKERTQCSYWGSPHHGAIHRIIGPNRPMIITTNLGEAQGKAVQSKGDRKQSVVGRNAFLNRLQ